MWACSLFLSYYSSLCNMVFPTCMSRFTCFTWNLPLKCALKVWLKSSKLFRKRNLNIGNVFLLFPYYPPLVKSMNLHWSKPESLFQNMLCANFGWYMYCTGASGEEDLTFCQYLGLYPFGNGRCPFFNKLASLTLNPGMICAMFVWNWLSGFWED